MTRGAKFLFVTNLLALALCLHLGSLLYAPHPHRRTFVDIDIRNVNPWYEQADFCVSTESAWSIQQQLKSLWEWYPGFHVWKFLSRDADSICFTLQRDPSKA